MATTVAVGSVQVSTSGALTGALLQQFKASLAGSSANSPPSVTSIGTASSPIVMAAPTGTGTNNTLIIPAGDQGVVSIPAGYQFVINEAGNNVSLVGGSAGELIIGDLNYAGDASSVVAGASVAGGVNSTTPGVVADSLAGAVLSFAGGSGTAIGAAAGQTFMVDAGASEFILAKETGDIIAQSGGASTVLSAAATAGAASATATGGTMTFFGFGTGGDLVNASGGNAALKFLGAGGAADTIMGGAGSDTVFATNSLYKGGTGSDLFVGGHGTSTVYGAARDTIYGGSGGGDYNFAANSTDYFAGGVGTAAAAMAADTVMLGAGTTGGQIWSNNNESLMLGAASGGSGAVVVAYGNNADINMMNAAGKDTVILLNAQLSSGVFTGNQTLTGSNAGGDVFAMFAASPYGLPADAAHTVVIDNWKASDVFDLSGGYTAAQAQAATTALASGASFTLSDGTTVEFQGAKPTTVVHI